MSEPSIKGSTFQGVVEDLHAAIAQGDISLEDAETRLEPADHPFLDPEMKTLPGSWYPIESYRRVVELLLDVVGHGDSAYLVKRGENAAVRLHEAGFYQQLEYVGRINESRGGGKTTLLSLKSQLRLIISVARSIYNFGEWNVEVDNDRLRIVVSDARALPDISVLTIEGFMNKMGEFSDSPTPVRWESQRPSRERVEFTMSAPISE